MVDSAYLTCKGRVCNNRLYFYHGYEGDKAVGAAKSKAERQPCIPCADNDTGHLPEGKAVEGSSGARTQNLPPVKCLPAGGGLFHANKDYQCHDYSLCLASLNSKRGILYM